ncbi:MAG: YicC family protein [Clostridiales bacterium]|nr:YicC family protein [Clostridiales bacterium]
MAHSMTGFGRSEKVFDTRRYSVEIKSVNSRFCDISIRMPKLFNFADSRIRKLISETLVRGKVDVYINFEDISEGSTEVIVNAGLVKAYSDAITNIASITGRPDDVNSSRLAVFPDVLTTRQKEIDEDKIYAELEQVAKEALDGMQEMRYAEGSHLVSDIIDKINSLEKIKGEIEDRAPKVIDEYKARLEDRIEELLADNNKAFYDEARITAEVAVFADKCAVDEELKRLTSHFAQGKRILAVDDSVGKKMDFLIQEINRETNTLGSKANDLEITNRILLMKNIVEEMREQIQNLV